MKSPITAKLSAQKNEIQSHREPKGGASGMELRKDGKEKMRPLNIATFPNSACRGKRWQSWISRISWGKKCFQLSQGSKDGAGAHLAELKERESEYKEELKDDYEPEGKDDETWIKPKHEGSSDGDE